MVSIPGDDREGPTRKVPWWHRVLGAMAGALLGLVGGTIVAVVVLLVVADTVAAMQCPCGHNGRIYYTAPIEFSCPLCEMRQSALMAFWNRR